MGSKLGVLKVAAKRVGLTLEEYQAKLDAGLKWCHHCDQWKPLESFGQDSSRGDGREARCSECRRTPDPKPRVIPSRKGQHHTAEAREKMSQARRGNTNRQGRPWTEAHLINLRQIVKARALRGPAHPRWKGGLSSINEQLRHSDEYKAWRRAVYRRDGFTCQHCGATRGGYLCAHHIKPWADYPALRFDVDNGITLCLACHAKQHPGRKLRNLFKGKRRAHEAA